MKKNKFQCKSKNRSQSLRFKKNCKMLTKSQKPKKLRSLEVELKDQSEQSPPRKLLPLKRRPNLKKLLQLKNLSQK